MTLYVTGKPREDPTHQWGFWAALLFMVAAFGGGFCFATGALLAVNAIGPLKVDAVIQEAPHER